MKKQWIIGLSALTVLAISGGVGATKLSTQTADAAAADILTQISPEMVEGASVRLADNGNGIRFQMTLSENDYQTAEGANAQYGMLILPADYAKATPVTKSVFSTNPDYYFVGQEGSVDTANKKPIINLTADYLTLYKGEYTLSGSIVGILDTNTVRPFMGIGYVAVTEGDVTDYKFATENDNVRSMAYVAQLALESGEYTEDEATLNEYIDKSVDYLTDYTVVHYVEGKDGTYTEKQSEQKSAPIHSALAAEDVKTEIEGYTYSSMTEVDHVYADGKTVVNVYYEDDAKQGYTYQDLGVHKVSVDLKKVSGENAGLQVTWNPTATEGLSGYGISFNFASKTYHYIYTPASGNLSRLEGFVAWDWGSAYRYPTEYGVTVTANSDGSTTALFPFTALDESASMKSVNVCLFNFVSGVVSEGLRYGYADCMAVNSVYADFTNTATYDKWSIYEEAPVTESVLSTYDVSTFGKSNATAKLEKVSGPQNGIRVSFTYTSVSGLFGFGIMLGDGSTGFRQLYATGIYNTITKNYVYDNTWAWGDYLAPSAYGVQASTKAEGTQQVLTLFYSYETLQNYGLALDANSKEMTLNLFEYVDDGTGIQYGCYNGMKNSSGTEILVDCGLAGFITWDMTNA